MTSETPIKVLIGILGVDQHEVGAMTVARILRDAGMEVVYAGRFNLPPAIVGAAVAEDADIIGLSCHSWEYLHYMDEMLAELDKHGVEIPIVVGGSVITAKDDRAIRDKGVAAAFGPTATPEGIVATIRELAAG
ncbi:MAG: cobalamin-dependent protein [Alphaproteobacteria bacterium]|jgi:methylmalonyl-CoA mutase C-terminal domain/subunit|nr:cobalamin-dependent protein [Alphaproteobacteria bacterium]MDP6563555.1 cobalamin-dependent protein [Alphaproteobacteria bacterium]MDP6815006.1 cobalamin-dependent protein [Alphaproteobacteria bacterium]